MKRSPMYLLFALLLTGSLFVSCKDDEEPSNEVVFEATMKGENERPNATPSTATGTATLTFNKQTKIFTIVVTHNVQSPTNGHIHKGATDVAGGVVFPFTSFTSPINFTSAALTAEQEADLNAGLYYVNIHTAAFSGGEIRGQLIKK